MGFGCGFLDFGGVEGFCDDCVAFLCYFLLVSDVSGVVGLGWVFSGGFGVCIRLVCGLGCCGGFCVFPGILRFLWGWRNIILRFLGCVW